MGMCQMMHSHFFYVRILEQSEKLVVYNWFTCCLCHSIFAETSCKLLL